MEFQQIIPILKQIVVENLENPNIKPYIDDTMGDEPVLNFWMIENENEWLKAVEYFNMLVKSKVPDFDVRNMPYSPYFIAIQGVQSE